METTSETSPRCCICETPLGAGGRPPRDPDAPRFCSENRRCIAARKRYIYRRKLGPVAVEDRPCSTCGAAMSSRPSRVTDRPDGRWCRDWACQRRKLVAGINLAAAAERERLEARPEVPCPKCGRKAAKVGMVHKNRDDVLCDGTWMVSE